MVLCFTYTPVFTVSLISVLERVELRARANERSIIGGKLTFHVLSPKCPSSRWDLISLH